MRFSLTAFTLDNHTGLQSSVLKKKSTCSHELSLILNRYISLRRLDNTSILQRVKKNDFPIKRCCGVDPGSSIIQFNDISSGHTILFHFRYVQKQTIQTILKWRYCILHMPCAVIILAFECTKTNYMLYIGMEVLVFSTFAQEALPNIFDTSQSSQLCVVHCWGCSHSMQIITWRMDALVLSMQTIVETKGLSKYIPMTIYTFGSCLAGTSTSLEYLC